MASMDVPADRAAAVPAVKPVAAKPAYITWLTGGSTPLCNARAR
jgi:hypothetical protein